VDIWDGKQNHEVEVAEADSVDIAYGGRDEGAGGERSCRPGTKLNDRRLERRSREASGLTQLDLKQIGA
jgi:hypothetical protein